MSEKHGGPAFPQPFTEPTSKAWGIEGAASPEHQGMSLRDYFAGQALLGIITGTYGSNERLFEAAKRTADKQGLALENVFAEGAYEIADAMLKERAK